MWLQECEARCRVRRERDKYAFEFCIGNGDRSEGEKGVTGLISIVLYVSERVGWKAGCMWVWLELFEAR